MKLFVVMCFCAVAAALPSSRIVGGEEADAGAWPWQISLFRYGKFHCGATIIDANTAVTAASCLGGDNANYYVKIGSHRKNADCSFRECIQQQVRTSFIHPGYEADAKRGNPNDIAVITWRDSVEESSVEAGRIQVKYAKRTKREDEVAKNCYITGWGEYASQVEPPLRLHQAKMSPITKSRCLQDWDPINDGHLCVLDLHHMKATGCVGDKGGPLVCEFTKGIWELAGVSSWGSVACDPTVPYVYSRISYFNEWINSVIVA